METYENTELPFIGKRLPDRPGDVGLGDPGVGGRAHVFPRTLVFSRVSAAGLAVSLLT